MTNQKFNIGDVSIGLDEGLFVISGPCVIEDLDSSLAIAKQLSKISESCGVPIIFKASFDKANRSSISSYRGPGLEKGLEILDKVRELVAMYDLPSEIPSELTPQDLVDAMEIDKKTESGRLKFILPESIGSVRIEDDVDRELIKEVLAGCKDV